MSQFLKIVLPLLAVFLLGFVLEFRAEVRSDRERLLGQETSVIQRGVRQVQRELGVATGDLFFIADLVAEAVDADAPDRLAALERSLLALVRSHTGYVQVQFIGTTGQELLRVENDSRGPRIASASEFRDRSDHAYFSESVRLEAGELWVSPMELQVEGGTVAEPHQPVLQLATPIEDGAGQRRGIAVLSAQGESFLRAFERNPDAAGVQRMIVDSDGFWLQHRPELEWGSVLEHGMSFQRTFPEVWEQLAASRHGRVESPDGLFYFDTVSLRPRSPGAAAEARGQSSWLLISLVPSRLLDDIAARVATRLLVVAVPLLFTLLVIGWFLVAARGRRRAADEALQNAEQVRSAMMTAALDAIVVMDEKGTALEFNPMAQRIFGYTLAEARGKLVADLIIPQGRREDHRRGLEHFLRTGEGPIIDKHIAGMPAMRKGGAEFPIELTVCPIFVGGKRLFFGFLRDLSEPVRTGVESDAPSASI
jgi:PAS domain S-box-containing protein